MTCGPLLPSESQQKQLVSSQHTIQLSCLHPAPCSACKILVPRPGIEPRTQKSERLNTRSPWNSPLLLLKSFMVPFGEGNGTPLQYSCLEIPMDGRAWWAAVRGVANSQARLSYFTFTFHFHALEKEVATHFSVLAWRIPGTEEPSGLPSLGSHRVGHD